jgi:hypothetical protein
MALYKQLSDRKDVSREQALLQARDLMDFSMQGTFTTVRFLTQVVPFMNAQLQGMYKLGRSAKDDPARFAVVTGAVALMSLALLAAYGDDDDWKRREDWDRDNYWWFKFGGTAFRIPKPFEIGAIGTLAERSAELLFDQEMTGARFRKAVGKVIGDQLSMNPIPQLVKPIIDISANTDSFTGRPIESTAMASLAPEARYRSSTSMVARGASTALGGALSPVQIDHLVRSYFSWLGAFAVGTADRAIRAVSDEPEKPASDMFKVLSGGMVSDLDGAQSRYVTQMYEQAKTIDEAYATWRHHLKLGETEKAASLLADRRNDIVRYHQVQKVKRVESALNALARRVEADRTKTGRQKREELNRIAAQKDRIARSVAGFPGG